jgi:NADPH:quinone reductase-like Zn-dependent oxidoreductase
MAFNLIHLYDQIEILASLWEELERLALPPPRIGEVFPFAELPAAIRRLQSGRTVGKVVVSVSLDSDLEAGVEIM